MGNSSSDAGGVEVGERGTIPPCSDRPGGQAKQEIRKRHQYRDAGRVIGETVELIAEDLSAQANIVLAPGPKYGVRDVKIITGCFAAVVGRVAKLKGSQNLNLRNAPFLGVAEAVYPHLLIGECSSGNALTRKTRKAKAELVDRTRGEDVGFGDGQVPVLKSAERREARHAGAEERNVLIGV